MWEIINGFTNFYTGTFTPQFFYGLGEFLGLISFGLGLYFFIFTLPRLLLKLMEKENGKGL